MTTFLETVGPAIGRASWQGAALALVVAGLVRCCGERLSPRWRFLLWGIVVLRLLVVVTPASSWSVFNLSDWDRPREVVTTETPVELTPAPVAPLVSNSPPIIIRSEPEFAPISEPLQAATPPETPRETRPVMAASASPAEVESPARSQIDATLVAHVLTGVWLAGCIAMLIMLLRTAFSLRRRLALCQPVRDSFLLALLNECRQTLRLKQTPQLLVTPDSFGPCVVGTWHPRIVLPEQVVTQSSPERLRHILAHELAHVARGDLLTNWLLLAVRVLHWFNPLAWLTIREMQAERESACDELAFTALGSTDRTAYAATLLEVATGLTPSPLAPGLIGFFSSPLRLKIRIERLLQSTLVTRLRTSVCAALWLALALLGLTDATPIAQAEPPQPIAAAPAATPPQPATARNQPPQGITLTGHCTNVATKAAMPGVSVRLYKCEGRTSPPVEIARTISRADGSFSFSELVPPRPWNHLDRLVYGCLGVSDDGLVGTASVMQIMHMPGKRLEEHTEIHLSPESSTLTGQVLNSRGLPVLGAKILPYSVDDRPVADLQSVTTDAEGKFKLEKVPVGLSSRTKGKLMMSRCRVQHPDYPETFIKAVPLPGDVVVTLPAACVVTGSVVDSVTGKPAVDALVTARQLRKTRCVTTNAAGQFRFVLQDGTYDFLVDAPERVCVAVAGHNCPADKQVELPPFRLIAGGFITGQVVVKETGKPVTISERGQPLMVGLFGPSQTATQLLFPTSLVPLDAEGRFRLRAAPGKNFPYIHNAESDSPFSIRNAQSQTAVVVNEGQTATCQLHTLQRLPYDPEREGKMASQKIQEFIADLPQDPLARTRAIIVEVRKLPHHNSLPETWGSLIRELVKIGPAAVPLLCEELDHSNRREVQLRALNVREDEIASARQWEENPLLRFYGFTLRAIGDKRAVPALIRAIPRTLIESASDMGYTIKDKELMEFMLDHDLYEHERNHFGYGRPYREITGAIKSLTGQDFDTFDLNWVNRRQDPRRLALQQLAFQRLAQRYQEWWEANAAKLTSDSVYHKVNLRLIKELPPTNEPAPVREGTHTRPSFSGLVVSPPDHSGPYISHFYDLDTMLNRAWPENIPNNASSLDKKIFTFWTSQNGLDVMCVRHRTADGKEFCVLRSLGMQVRELTPAEHGQLGTLLAAGKLPEGRPVTGDLLIHVDEKTKQPDPAAPAIFLYLTREGNRGVIQVQSQSRAGVTVGLVEIQP